MELIPRQLLVGVFTPPPGVPGSYKVTVERLNRIWSELAPQYGYLQFQLAPDGSGAEIAGGEGEGISIQPPLLQIRDPVQLTVEQSAQKAQDIIKVIARHLGVDQVFNLGVRLIYHAPVSDKDARAFVLNRLLRTREEDLGELGTGQGLWAGVKYFIEQGNAQYTLVIEPLFADETHLFIDLDSEYPGEASLDDIKPRTADVETYVRQAVSAYLDKH